MGGKVTIKKIAELAGVSRGTVDRVLNNRSYVKEDVCLIWLGDRVGGCESHYDTCLIWHEGCTGRERQPEPAGQHTDTCS